MDQQKTCKTCNREKPASLAHFNTDKRCFDKLTVECASCIEWRTERRNHANSSSKRYKMLERWHEKHKDALSVRDGIERTS